MIRRPYQDQAFWADKRLRRYLLMWLRQGGKTSILADQALREMGARANHLVTFVSASLNIGSEFVEKESQTWARMLDEFRAWAAERKMKVTAGERKTDDADSYVEMPEDIDLDAIAGALERSKFEVRLWHSRTRCSRTKVIAPNIATARSWSGSVKFDEVAFVRDLRTMLAELEPIFSTDPNFTFLMATTPPADYAHYAYELMTPADGREDWPHSPDGHWFQNREGLWVHRVTIDDAHLAGRKIYDPDTGAEQSPDEAREASLDKDGWDRSNRLVRPATGSSAISPPALYAAQQRGKHACAASEWPPPHGWWDHIGEGSLAVGIDPATTEGKKSNPTGLAVVERQGHDYIARLVTWYKTADPNEAERRVLEIVETLLAKGHGPMLKGTSVDATNERYWATSLAGALPCHVRRTYGSENVTHRGETQSFKFYSCSILADAAESGRLALPWHRYVDQDFGRMLKGPGTFYAPVGPNGEHADTFDAVRQAMALLQSSGPAAAEAVSISGGGGERPGIKNPWAAKFDRIRRRLGA